MEVKETQDNELQKALDTLSELGLDIEFDEEVEKAEKKEALFDENEEEGGVEGESEDEEKEEGGEEEEIKSKKEVKKSENDDLLKSVESMMGSFADKLTASFDSKLQEMRDEIEKIGNAPVGRKSSTKLEKGEGDDLSRSGAAEISWSTSKEGILGFMGGIFEKANAEGKSEIANMYGEEIMKCNAGGGMLSKAILADLEKNHNVRVIK